MSDPVLLLFFLGVVRGRFFDKVIFEQSFEQIEKQKPYDYLNRCRESL